MLYRIFLFVFFMLNLWFKGLGQTDFTHLLEQGGEELQNYIDEHPAKEWTPTEFLQVYQVFKKADYSKKNKLYEELGRSVLLGSMRSQTLRSTFGVEEIKENFKILEEFRRRLKQEEKWEKWADITNLLALNSYSDSDKLSYIGRYYDELMEHWDRMSIPLKVEIGGYAGNHFMGVEQNFEKAAIYYEKVVNLASVNAYKKIAIYSGLAELYLRKRDFDRSLEYSNKVLSIDSLTNFIKLQELTRCAKTHKEFGNLTQAEKYFSQVQKLLPPDIKLLESNPFFLNIYSNVCAELLKIQVQKANLKKAKFYNDKLNTSFFALMKGGQSAFLVLEALMEYDILIKDREHYLFLEKIVEERIEAHGSKLPLFAPILTLMGDYWFGQKNAERALFLYNESLDLLKSSVGKEVVSYTQDEPQALVTLTKKLNVLYWQKQHDLMEKDNDLLFYQTTQEAVNLLDYVRQNLSTKAAKLKILNTAPQIYEYALEASWNLHQKIKDVSYKEKMYKLIEKSKSMLLLEALNESAAKDFGGVPKVLRIKENNFINDLKLYKVKLMKAEAAKNETKMATFRNIIFEKRTLLDELKKQLEEEYPKYYALKFQSNIASLSDVQLALKEHQAQFISYFVGKRNLYICTVTSGAITMRIETLPNTNFSKDIWALRLKLARTASVESFDQKEYATLLRLSHQLYLMLLKDETKNLKRLIISPDGLLHYIPFEVLLSKEVKPTTINFGNLPYLMNDYVVSYNYTATLWLKSLALGKSSKSNNAGILAMAASYEYSKAQISQDRMQLRKGLIELEGAKGEVSFLQKIYKGAFYIGETATEATFRSNIGKHSMIHLALHGVVDNRIPMNSGLFFTEDGDTIQDNVLFAYELSGLDMNANLLVLSACSTGDGTYKRGEGVLSIGRGFMYAGAASIMTTLWQINDQSSQRIMRFFYENLSKGITKDKALQQAKLAYIKEADGIINHPIFWAAFVLIGDIGSVTIYQSTSFLWYLIPLIGLIGFGIWFKNKK